VAERGAVQYGEVCMRPLLLGAITSLSAACIPFEPYWLLQDTWLLGVRLNVVEPGGYATLVRVPEGHTRAEPLPLDTVELEWLAPTAPGIELQPPLWLICTTPSCMRDNLLTAPNFKPSACPHPLPLDQYWPCRLGEGERVRVSLGSIYGYDYPGGQPPILTVLAVGSRDPELSPATCLERYRSTPREDLQQCLFVNNYTSLGPAWALLPFSDELALLPPELRELEGDTHPDIVAFRVTRERGRERVELLVTPGDTVEVEPHERITVLPLMLGGGVQTFAQPTAENDPYTGRTIWELKSERVNVRARLTALVDEFEGPDSWSDDREFRWVVPDHPEPALLYVEARDNRNGITLASLRFEPAAP
jgi:hypothetical protein